MSAEPGESPVVVLGRGHSGTRLLAWTLERLGVRMGARPDKPTGDVQDRRLTRLIKRLAYRAIDRPPTAAPTPRERSRLARALARYRRSLGADTTHWGWKFPETSLIGPAVQACCPSARYLHIVRDGRAVALRRHLTDDPHRRLGHKVLAACGALELPPPLRAARSWAWQLERIAAFLRTIPPARRLEVRFEQLITQPRESLERIARFVERPTTPALHAWLARTVDPTKANELDRLDRPTRTAIEQELGDALNRWGYR